MPNSDDAGSIRNSPGAHSARFRRLKGRTGESRSGQGAAGPRSRPEIAVDQEGGYRGCTAATWSLAANLIDRLYSPARFLRSVHERINPQGILVLASPYTWLEEHTQREEWIGGFKKDGENHTTLDGLKDLLGGHFRLVEGPTAVPFVIRETSRKFQHTLSEVTVWERL